MTVYWLTLAYRCPKERCSLLCGGAAAVLTAIVAIPSMYYSYTMGLGIESVVIDILIFFIAVFLGQLLGAHVAQHCNSKLLCRISAVIFVILISAYAIFTFFPPVLPIFIA